MKLSKSVTIRSDRNPMAFVVVIIGITLTFCGKPQPVSESSQVLNWWLTTGDRKMLLTQQPTVVFKSTDPSLPSTIPVIEIDSAQRHQSMDGFGYSLTGGSAFLLGTLTRERRSELLKELFSTGSQGVGISYLRISIGSSDLNDHPFTYDDLGKGERDIGLTRFNLAPDDKIVIPVLKEILLIKPSIRIMGSPWSAPAWMKTNGSLKGGSLKPELYETYAGYLIKYLQAMSQEGIKLDAITIQNEPENPNNTPSMLMTAKEQGLFVKKYLGPRMRSLAIKTKIVLFDHNCDHPEYPIAILDDPEAKPFVDGTAFHLYLGEIGALSKVHDRHPDKNIYFTEQWTSSQGNFGDDLRWHTKNLTVGAPRNWSKNVLEWNLAADSEGKPHTNDGGCDQCLGALTIGDSIVRNVSYYIVAHSSRFVPPGSVRIASNIIDGLYNVAYVTPDSRQVLIVVNDNDTSKKFAIRYNQKTADVSLSAGAVATFVW